MITTVLLDIDDTLLDFRLCERTALQLSFVELGVPYRPAFADMYRRINARWWQRYDNGEVGMAQVIVERFVDLFAAIGLPMPLDFAQTYERHLRDQHFFIRGAKGFLQRLGKLYRVYAVSNGRVAVQQKRLRDSGLDKMLDGVFVSEQIGYHKPQKEFFDYVAAHIPDYCAQNTVLVGDSLTSDIPGGIAAGIHTIWYNRDGRAFVGSVAPEYVGDDFRLIEQYIAQIG